MAPGTKRIAVGGLALAIVAWIAIDAFLPAPPSPQPEARGAEGLKPIPERETKAPRPAAPAAMSEAARPDRAVLAEVLVGCFKGLREDGAQLTERYWLAADGALEGEFTELNHDGTPAFHETLRIAFDGAVWRYHPAPMGVPAKVSFALEAHGPGTLRFANRDHDFPQVIAYERRGPSLATKVDGVEGGVAKSDAYSTQAAPPEQRCP